MLLPQVLLAVWISEFDRKYAENFRYSRPRLGRPNTFSRHLKGRVSSPKPMFGRIWQLCDRPFPVSLGVKNIFLLFTDKNVNLSMRN